MPLLRVFLIALVLIPFIGLVNSKDKPIISGSALFTINQSIPLLARIDTGASRSSINAKDIKVENGHQKMKDNVGKIVSFNIINAKGVKFPVSTRILAVKTTKTPQGREHRYLVSLLLMWEGKESKLKVNLRDRSNLDYKLLIGRDWLNENALVNVNVKGVPEAIIGSVADYIIAEDFPITARIDTGAASTSINATNIEVSNSAKKMGDNIGKMIHFDITNDEGNVKRLSAAISQVTEITNAMGSEFRYKVAIKIKWRDRVQMLNMNLKDRSKLTYKMLIGRDWITDNAIVDSSM